MNREQILKTALDLTMGDRNASYGDPTQNHDNIAKLWRSYWNIRTGGDWSNTQIMDAEDVEIMMALLKIARIAQRLAYKADNYIDAAAYIAMASEANNHPHITDREKEPADDIS